MHQMPLGGDGAGRGVVAVAVAVTVVLGACAALRALVSRSPWLAGAVSRPDRNGLGLDPLGGA
jgi:hypothetical protein